MLNNFVTIVKNGSLVNIDEDRLIKGDLVVLQAGDIVPADLKLVEARGLEVDEFDINGEILPVDKKVDDDDAILYMGSHVLRGMAKGIVVATGGETEYGKVLQQEWKIDRVNPFQFFNMKYLILIILFLPALIKFFNHSNQSIWAAVLFILGSILLIMLQNDMLFQFILVNTELKKLNDFNIQIRDKSALADFHKTNLMCFDKTGVLTTRFMEVKALYFADKRVDANGKSGNNSILDIPQIVKMCCALCNDVQLYERINLANPVDKALISFAEKMGINLEQMFSKYKRIYDVPFNSENRYMACGFEWDEEEIYFLKGDPEVVIGICSHHEDFSGVREKIDWDFRRLYSSKLNAINKIGDNAIALAYTKDKSGETPIEYTFICLIQIENPLLPKSPDIIKEIRECNIRCILLTGDKATTAVQVGKSCGIVTNSQTCLVGKVIDHMQATDIMRQAAYCSIFARLVPSQKGYLIRLLQLTGQKVAMIGDGPNDGIALKVADVGISFLDNSSPIARRLSKILISDLTDLLRLMESANRIWRRARILKFIRISVIVASLLVTYLWFFI